MFHRPSNIDEHKYSYLFNIHNSNPNLNKSNKMHANEPAIPLQRLDVCRKAKEREGITIEKIP
jgi:hypothetical protein